MILVATGASLFPFDRLLRAVDGLATDEPLVVQHGPSAIRPAGARCIPYMPLDQLAALVRDARVVVTHAGAGSILLALTNGKRPVVVPRRHAFGETVDDHQLETARRFERSGFVILVEDPARLREVLAGDAPATVELAAGEPPLVRELRGYVTSVVDRRSVRLT